MAAPPGMKCNGCGVVLDPTEDQVNAGVDRVLDVSLADAHRHGGVCPLCGHSKAVSYWNRKTVLFPLLLACLFTLIWTAASLRHSRNTERAAAVQRALAQMRSNADVVRRMGTPLTMGPGVSGDIRRDETGWKEADLSFQVRGPKDQARVHLVGGNAVGQWVFTTFEIVFEKQHKKLDLVSGKIVEYDPSAYIQVHTQAMVPPDYTRIAAPAASFDGTYPCVFADVSGDSAIASIGRCAMPTTHAGAVDRFQVDLRDGKFVLRQTDLRLQDVFDVPLTRTYTSEDWLGRNRVHAFGRNSNHPYDVAPLGTRNPYTFIVLALEDGDMLYFPRISKGTGYANAVFQHTETSTRFYKAILSWNGDGWTTKLADGSEIRFPESYNAKSLAQGAATEIRDAAGNKLELQRDPQRNLRKILTPHGHWIRFTYDDQARITRAEDDAGHWTTYAYNGYGMLVNAINSSGRARHFDYQGSLMTAIADEHGHTLLRNWYQSGALVRQQYANGDVYEYHYTWNAKHSFAKSVSITLPDGTRQEVWTADTIPQNPWTE